MLNDAIARLVTYGVRCGLLPECEKIYATNLLLDCLKEDDYTEPDTLPEEIDLERARKAEDRARERLNRKDADLDVARAELALKRALARQDILA